MVPPLVSRPVAWAGKPSNALSQSSTTFSTSTADCSKPARWAFIPDASMSASIA